MVVNEMLSGVKMPVPPLQTPPAATVTIPFKEMSALFTQAVELPPALAVGPAVKVSSTSSGTALQFPLPVVVRVSVAEPLAISAADGV